MHTTPNYIPIAKRTARRVRLSCCSYLRERLKGRRISARTYSLISVACHLALLLVVNLVEADTHDDWQFFRFYPSSGIGFFVDKRCQGSPACPIRPFDGQRVAIRSPNELLSNARIAHQESLSCRHSVVSDYSITGLEM